MVDGVAVDGTALLFVDVGFRLVLLEVVVLETHFRLVLDSVEGLVVDGGFHGWATHQLLVIVVLYELSVGVQPNTVVAYQNLISLDLFVVARH